MNLFNINGSLKNFKKQYIDNKITTTCVYDHIQEQDDINLVKPLFDTYKNYYVSSNILNAIYQNMNIQYKPKCVITDGVDLEQFYPMNLERFQNLKSRNLVIGWVGNSEWNNRLEDFKGVNTILKPAIRELQEDGYSIDTYFADRKERMISHDKMVEYYEIKDIELL